MIIIIIPASPRPLITRWVGLNPACCHLCSLWPRRLTRGTFTQLYSRCLCSSSLSLLSRRPFTLSSARNTNGSIVLRPNQYVRETNPQKMSFRRGGFRQEVAENWVIRQKRLPKERREKSKIKIIDCSCVRNLIINR